MADQPWTLCGECDQGILWGPSPACTCAPGPEGQHHPYCGAQPCPNGCWDKLRASEEQPVPDPHAQQRTTWRKAIAQHKWRQRRERRRPAPPAPGPGMIRRQPP
jgi:hypothetical protein